MDRQCCPGGTPLVGFTYSAYYVRVKQFYMPSVKQFEIRRLSANSGLSIESSTPNSVVDGGKF